MAVSLFDVERYLRNEARSHRRAAATLEGLANRVEKVISAALDAPDDVDCETIVEVTRMAIAPGDEDDD